MYVVYVVGNLGGYVAGSVIETPRTMSTFGEPLCSSTTHNVSLSAIVLDI
jgi:hypothetical protein